MSDIDEAMVEYVGEDEPAFRKGDAVVIQGGEIIKAGDAVSLRGMPAITVPATTPDPYAGVSAQPLDDRATAVLLKYAVVPDEWIDIKPNGQIYLPHMRLRGVLDEAFGFMGWGLVPVGEYHVEREPKKGQHGPYEKVTLYREYRFYVAGRFVRQVMGGGQYMTNNADSNYSDAAEACESYALNRCGKFFGIAGQCWDPDYAEQWKAKYARRDGDKWKKKPKKDSGAGVGRQAVSAGASDSPSSDPPTSGRLHETTPPAAPEPDVSTNWKPTRTIMIASCGPIKQAKNKRHYRQVTSVDGTKYQFWGSGTCQVAELATGEDTVAIEHREEAGTGEYAGRTFNHVEKARII